MNGSLYDLHAAPVEALFDVPRLRRELLSFAQGKVLEVGAGTGINFKYYPDDVEVIAVEPDSGMRKRAVAKSKARPRITVESAEAEALPFPDQAFDTVVATLALCSVDDPEAALREIYRVLKSGGRFLMMEHIRKDTPLAGKTLDILTPGWQWLSDGCRLNRSPAQWLSRSQFQLETYRPLWRNFGGFWVLKK